MIVKCVCVGLGWVEMYASLSAVRQRKSDAAASCDRTDLAAILPAAEKRSPSQDRRREVTTHSVQCLLVVEGDRKIVPCGM